MQFCDAGAYHMRDKNSNSYHVYKQTTVNWKVKHMLVEIVVILASILDKW